MYGVSLKKTPEGKPTKTVYNLDKTNVKKVTYVGSRITAASKKFLEDDIGKDVYIAFSVNGSTAEMQIRTFSAGMSGWQGEIKGATAAGGKIGGGNLQDALILAGIPKSAFIDQTSFKSQSSTMSTNTISKFALMYKYLSGDTRTINIITEDVKKMLKQYDNNWLYSKYLGMQFLYVMLNSGKQNEVMQNVVSIASSTTAVSSVFIKYS